MSLLAFLCGIVFGFAFGLAGIGLVFVVPMLVYVLGMAPHRAVCVAMIAASSLSAVAVAWRWRGGDFDFRACAMLAATGILGAPLGAWIGQFLSGKWLMAVFACFVAIVALRLFVHGAEPAMPGVCALARKGATQFALAITGLAIGIVAGLLGVGGLLIVPSLVLLGGVEIHRAVATSMPVIFTISFSALSSHFVAGQRVPPGITALLVAGGALGMIAGTPLGKRLPTRQLQTVFAAAMLGIAIFILVRTFG